ncbi:pyrroline-5-carboxylate reductase 3-like [Oppia nitens]|uniref:pyrroline-5-carboxylate reductase 3-like n=1 Tax=Oppia nitens TaxID=1686743 RepID=UPI0023D9BA6D|nr:pyrroline-5-carboxylate reductase 3-like [Oppia nitens]
MSKHSKKLTVDISKAKIGFIGAGRMTESLLNGFINYGKLEASRLYVAAPTTKNLERLKQQYSGLHITKRNLDIFAKYGCDIVFIAVHGSVIRNCYKQGGERPFPLTTNFIPNMKKPLFILSLVTGFTLKEISQCLLNPEHPEKYLIEMHRIVINCAVAYGLGICAVDVEPDSKKIAEPIRGLLSKVAKLEFVPESQMDAACAACGAGLAFSYYFIAAMSDGATKMGLSRDMATKFAAKTVQSAAQSLLESGKSPTELRDDVCSPAGPAIYGIHVLDKADCASGVSAAVEAAHKRAAELAKEGEKN